MKSAHATDTARREALDYIREAIEQLTFGSAQAPRPDDARSHQPRYDHILVAYDGSEGAQFALDWAKDLARANGSKVTIVTAFVPPQIADGATLGYAWYPDYTKWYGAIEKRSREAVESAASILNEQGIEAQSIVVEGHAGRTIARLAGDKRVDLVLVGASRGGRIQRAILGSTAESLLSQAPCNVLIARGPPQPRRVLVATDGSNVSYRAIAYAYHRASQTSADLIVEHVLELPGETLDDVPPQEFVKAVADRLDLPEAPANVRYVLDVGHPAKAILKRAEDDDAGLIVVGSHGKDRLERFVIGSTSRRVASEAHTSVLVVRDVKEESH